MNKRPLKLYEYQKRWMQDDSRFKIGMFARQTGKTLIATLEIVVQVLDAAAQGKTSSWLIVSASEKQSINALSYVRKHLFVLDQIFQSKNNRYLEDRTENKHEIVLPNGSAITSIAANPDTIRGYSRHVYADEYAFHEDQEAMWRALFAVCSNKKLFRITSTPNGKGNRFYRLMSEPKNGWSKHRVDIYEAIQQGLPREIDELKQAMGDPDGWAQEYELQWLDEATSWLPYDMIAACEGCDPRGHEKTARERGTGPCYIGIDIGRRHDLFVLWVLEKQGDVFYERELIAERSVNFAAQEAALERAIETYRPQRVCIDQTGMGEQFTERAKDKYGTYTVEGILFNNTTKLDLANGLRRHFEERSIRIHAGDKLLRDDLHSLKRTTTSAGNVRFVADRSENGHADRAWALALALHAGHEEYQPFEYESIEKDPWDCDMGASWDW